MQPFKRMNGIYQELLQHIVEREKLEAETCMEYAFSFFWPCPWRAEVPGPGLKLVSFLTSFSGDSYGAHPLLMLNKLPK